MREKRRTRKGGERWRMRGGDSAGGRDEGDRNREREREREVVRDEREERDNPESWSATSGI